MRGKGFSLAFTILSVLIILISTNQVKAENYILPDTGQTNCYDNTGEIPCPEPGEPFYGQDANYESYQPAYQLSPDGLMVTDIYTGLVWQQADDNETRDWDNALTYCEELSLGGYSDWRLPYRIELVSIVDYGAYLPAIDSVFCLHSNMLWSSSTLTTYKTFPWAGFFSYGSFGPHSDSGYTYGVLCVHGKPLQFGPFLNNNNGSVTDWATNIIWQQADDGQTRTWQEAMQYCESLDLAGQTDWRLPNIRELQSIVDDARYDPAIDPTFSASSLHYWSSTPYASENGYSWCVSGSDGVSSADPLGNTNYVRCVRDGPSPRAKYPTIPSIRFLLLD